MANLETEELNPIVTEDFQNYVRCHIYLQQAFSRAVVPCVKGVIKEWHNKQKKRQNQCCCRTCPAVLSGVNDQRTQRSQSPWLPKSCKNCTAFGHAVEDEFWPNHPSTSWPSLCWTNINPKELYHKRLEIVKVFALDQPENPGPTTFGDFDAAAFTKVMMRFRLFHKGNRQHYAIIKTVRDCARNHLSHVHVNEMKLNGQECSAIFQHINKLIDFLDMMYAKHFNPTEVREELKKAKRCIVTDDMKQMILKPVLSQTVSTIKEAVDAAVGSLVEQVSDLSIKTTDMAEKVTAITEKITTLEHQGSTQIDFIKSVSQAQTDTNEKLQKIPKAEDEVHDLIKEQIGGARTHIESKISSYSKMQLQQGEKTSKQISLVSKKVSQLQDTVASAKLEHTPAKLDKDTEENKQLADKAKKVLLIDLGGGSFTVMQVLKEIKNGVDQKGSKPSQKHGQQKGIHSQGVDEVGTKPSQMQGQRSGTHFQDYKYFDPSQVMAALQLIEEQSSQTDAEHRLLENCRQAGLIFHGNTPSDGNCFFHAVSDQLSLLCLPPLSAFQLRKFVVEFLKSHPSIEGPEGTIEFSATQPDWDAYLKYMSRDGMWADAIVLVAMAHLLNLNILVVTSSPQGAGEQAYQWIVGDTEYKGQPIMLGHVWEWHYRSLAPVASNPSLFTVQSPSSSQGSVPYAEQHHQHILANYTKTSPPMSRGPLDSWPNMSTGGLTFAPIVHGFQQEIVQVHSKFDLMQDQKTAVNHLQAKLQQWRMMSKELYLFDRREIRFGRSCTAIADTDDIFVDLELIEEEEVSRSRESVAEPPRGRKLESYQELLTLKDKHNNPLHHILLIGNAGSGKTTMVSRIAYQWALGVGDDGTYIPVSHQKTVIPVLSAMELVVVLDIRNFKSDQTLAEAIKRQLLPGVSADEIEMVLSCLGKKCLVLLDGFDEIPRGLRNHALDSPQLSRLFVIVTTRPHMTDRFFRRKRGYCRVQLLGFSEEGSRQYIDKYFNNLGKPALANTLKQTVKDTPILTVLSSFPILLVMMCLLWEVAQKKNISFQSMTRLYKEAVKYINRPFEDRDDDDDMPRHCIDHVLLTLGETALKELFDNTIQISREEFGDETVLKQSVDMGLLLESEGKLVDDTSVTFIHKTFQEYCAAVYLSGLIDTNPSQFEAHLRCITKDNVNDMEYLLQFCCGLNMAAANVILSHVVNLKDDGAKKNYVWTRPLTLLYEAELSPEGISLNTQTLHDSLLAMEKCTTLIVENAILAAAVGHFTAKTHNIARETWLGKIKLFEAWYAYDKIDTLLKVLDGMSALETVEIRVHKLQELKGKLDGMAAMQSRSIKCLSMKGQYSEIFTVCVVSLVKFLNCIPSVENVNLEQVNLTDSAEDEPSPLSSSLKEVGMTFGHEQCTMSVSMLERFLRFIPSLAKISLKNANLVGKLDDTTPLLSESMRKFIVSCKEYHLSMNTILSILKCMPSLKEVTLQGVILTGDLDDTRQSLSDSVTELLIAARYNKLCKMNAITILKFVSCVPSLARLTLEAIELEGGLDYTTPILNNSVKEFTMSSGTYSDSCSVSVMSLTRMLKCMPSLEKISLVSMNITGRVGETFSILSESIHEFGMYGSYHKKCVVSEKVFVNFLKCMSLLAKVTLCFVSVKEEELSGTKLCWPLQEFNCYGCIFSGHFLSAAMSEQASIKILRLMFLECLLTKEDIIRVFTPNTLASLKILEVDKTVTKGFSGGIDALLNVCLPNAHELHLSNLLVNGTECNKLFELFVENGKQSSSVMLPMQKLVLSNNSIGDSLANFSKALKYTPSLSSLSLRRCGAQEKQFNELEPHLSSLKNLKEIDLSENDIKDIMPILKPSCQYLRNLTVLKLQGSALTGECVPLLPLSVLSKLTELDLAKNSISSEGASNLAKSFSKNQTPVLQQLILRDNNIGSDGATALAQSFKHLPQLKTLNLGGNESIGVLGLQDIFRNLIHLSNLEWLGFHSVEFEDSDSNCPSLLARCLGTSDRKSSFLSLNANRLQSLRKVIKEFSNDE